jgi:hypothetical protein
MGLGDAMNWFERFCRQTGHLIHQVVKPITPSQKQQVSKTVEEKKINPNVTLRRTTIEEIEIRDKPSDR